MKSSGIQWVLTWVTGLVLWGIQAAVFGYAHLRFLTYLYLGFFLIYGCLQRKEHVLFLRAFVEKCRSTPNILKCIFVVGIIMQCLAMVGSGLEYRGGVEFFQSNSVDGVLHLGYIQGMAQQFPPKETAAYLLDLKNYHFWSDLVMADIFRVWHIPVALLFFQFFPVLLSSCTALAAYFIIRMWKGSFSAGMWSLFLLFFGGDAAYTLFFLLHRVIRFSSPAIDNGATQFLNMPHAFAKMIFLSGLIPLTYFLRTRKKSWLFLTVLLYGPLIGFKVYFGLYVAIGLVFLAAGTIMTRFFQISSLKIIPRIMDTFRKEALLLLCVASVGCIAAIVYLPVNKGSGGLFYSPLEWPKIFLSPDALDFRNWWLRQQVYQEKKNVRGLITLDIIAIAICLISVFGTRLIGFLPLRKTGKVLEWQLLLFCVPGIFIFTLLGLYTLQISGLFNVFNFFAVAIVPLSLFSAFSLSQLQKNKSFFSRVALLFFVVVTVPRALHDSSAFLLEYVHNAYERKFSDQQIAALTYIQKNTPVDSIIQSHPNNEADQQTPYVSYFSNRFTYLSGAKLLETHNQSISDQQSLLSRMLKLHSSGELSELLKINHISYLYVEKKPEQVFTYQLSKNDLQNIFENDAAIVYQVK